MSRLNYFTEICSLSELCFNAATLLKEHSTESKRKLQLICLNAEDKYRSICSALYCDFIPPLEREDIFMIADCFFSLIAEQTSCTLNISFCSNKIDLLTMSDLLCEACSILCDAAKELKNIKKESQMISLLRALYKVRKKFDKISMRIRNIYDTTECMNNMIMLYCFKSCFNAVDTTRRALLNCLYRNC